MVGRGSPITPWIFRPVFSYRCVLPVGINFNLTYGLKPQVSGIKIFTVYRQSIFQVEWLIATLNFRTNQLTNLTIVHCNNQTFYLFVSGNNSRGLGWKEEYHVYVNTSIEVIFKLTATFLPGSEGKAVDYCLNRSLIVLQQKTKRSSQNVHCLGLFTQKKVFSSLITYYV